LLRVGVLQAVAEGGGAAGCRHGLDCRRDGACRSKPTRHRSRLVQRSGLLAPRRSRQPALLRCLPSAPLAPCAAFRTRCRCSWLGVSLAQVGSTRLDLDHRTCLSGLRPPASPHPIASRPTAASGAPPRHQAWLLHQRHGSRGLLLSCSFLGRSTGGRVWWRRLTASMPSNRWRSCPIALGAAA